MVVQKKFVHVFDVITEKLAQSLIDFLLALASRGSSCLSREQNRSNNCFVQRVLWHNLLKSILPF